MKKVHRIEHLADLFLRYLAEHHEEDGGKAMGNFFETKGIYFDGERGTAISELLESRKLVKVIPNSLELIGFSEPEKASGDEEIMQPAHFLDGFGLDGSFSHYTISPKGLAFVSHDERLDMQGVTEEQENKRKWKDRAINAGIAILTALFIFFITEPFKNKSSNTPLDKVQNHDESHSIRPRLDTR